MRKFTPYTLYRRLNLLTVLLLALSCSALAQTQTIATFKSGKIRGKVVDAKTGETIIGANVVIAGTATGDATDIDGMYSIRNVDPGMYDVSFSYISYRKTVVTDVRVNPGETVTLNISLQPETLGLDAVTVTAQAATNSEAGLLAIQRKSLAVQDGLSSEFLGKSGDGNVASAIKRVPGVSLLNGNDVFIRGLGNRYSSINLNGSPVPSTNPNKKEAPVDLVSSSIVDNIAVQKTYTPDQPGEFSGGSVQITTKEFPNEQNIGFNYTTSYNSGSAFKNMLTYPGGNLDFLGYDDGKRTLPKILNASRLDTDNESEFVNELHRDWLIRDSDKSLPAQNFSLSYSDQFNVHELPVGLVSSFNYKYSQSLRQNQVYREIQSYNSNADQNVLNSDFLMNQGTENVALNGMINVYLKPGDNTKIGLKNLYSNELDNTAKTVTGPYINYPGNTRQTVLDFDRRSIFSTTALYETVFPNFFHSRLEVSLSYNRAERNRPDRRTTQYNQTPSGTYNIYFDDGGNTHYFEQQNDNNYVARIDYEVRTSDLLKFKTGVYTFYKDREFRARRFEYQNFRNAFPNTLRKEAPNVALDPDLVSSGLLDVVENTQYRDSYFGEQMMYSAYLNTIWNPMDKITLAVGARVEDSDQEVFVPVSNGSKEQISDVDHIDILPAASFIYNLSYRTNLRGAFSQTLARPEFREISNFRFQDFTGSQIVYGNPDLERTRIYNYDVRIETYPNPGELFAISFFYKKFTNPIELFYRFTERSEVQFKNGKEATLYGVEIEGRKNFTPNLQVIANASFIESETVVKQEDLFRVANARRPMYGQSPYTLNLSVFYAIPATNLSLSTSYHTFGPRVVTVGMGRHPDDEYEQPFHSVNMGAEYQKGSVTLSLGIENLLNESVVYKQGELITNKYNPGTTFEAGVKYSF